MPDVPLVGYTLGLCAIACAAFGLAPALHGTRASVADALKDGASHRFRLSLRNVLLGAQVAASVVLLTAAGLLIRGVQRASAADLESPLRALSVMSLEGTVDRYNDARRRAFVLQLSGDQDERADQGPPSR